ncbi:MAG TPA: hypothetical protein VFO06_02485 [Gemmatimonadales bacterium]|nr:hypothetical protein [Gemmatimonadales bacterium]
MTTQATGMSAQPRRLGRSIAAILAGLVVIFVLSLGTDQILHVLGVYPPWGQPMYEPGLNFLALAYRCVYAVLGCYLAARLAPYAPMLHALALGLVGVVLSSLGAYVAITRADLGPTWYPIALVLSSLPCAWLGGLIHRSRHGVS